jgi:hypothetical protein
MKPLVFVAIFAVVLVTPLAGSLLVGCVPPKTMGDPNGTGGGTSGVPGGGGAGGGGAAKTSSAITPFIDLDASLFGGAGGSQEDLAPPAPTGDANCGNTTSDSTRQPADVLLVLDRSSSMNYSTSSDANCGSGATGCTARWPALTSAVNSTLSSTSGAVNWGLKLYTSPGGSACTVNAGVEVPISATSVAAIQTQISNTKPGNNTPTAQAIKAAADYLKTVTDPNGKFILLATDGEPNCGGSGSSGSGTTNVQGTIDAITATKAAGFPVYVVGIGPSVGNLDNFAAAGGTTNYFPATSPQALTDAFASISKLVATCVFTSTKPPADPNNIAVYLNTNLVAKDDVDGWAFGADPSTIVLHGAACTEAMAATGSSVQILFGCPGGPPPPQVMK